MNNKITLLGMVKDEPTLSYTAKNGVKFYETKMETYRLSHNIDEVPVVFKEEFLEQFVKGECVYIEGDIRTRNEIVGDRSKLVMYAFVLSAEMAESDGDSDINTLELEGTICKMKELRQTPLGKLIQDYIVAVNGEFKKSAYCPCISWGGMAKFVNGLKVGNRIKAKGRFQSRAYDKNGVKLTAYELCLNEVSLVEEAPREDTRDTPADNV